MALSTAPYPRARLVVRTEDSEMTMAVQLIPIPQAAQSVDIPEPILRHLVACGVVAGVVAGDKHYCDLEQASHIAAQLAQARADVQGRAILVSDAAHRYGFHRHSIYNWIRKGWIRVIDPEPRVKIDEGDIAQARALANLVGQSPGRGVFPPHPRSGRPRKR